MAKDNINKLRSICLNAKTALYAFHKQSSNPETLKNLQSELKEITNNEFVKSIKDLYKKDLTSVKTDLLTYVVNRINNDYEQFLPNDNSPTAALITSMLHFSNNQYMLSNSNAHIMQCFELSLSYALNNLLLLCDLYDA